MVNICNEIIFLFSNIIYYADENGCSGSPLTPSHSNPAHWESGESDTVLQTSQQNHLSQDQEGPSTPKWNDKTRGNHLTLHVNQSDEQGQNNHTHENHITYQKGTTTHCHLFAKAHVLESW